MKKRSIICYVASKSGGHIIPCLTLAHEEMQKNPDNQILFFTTEDPLDIEIVSSSQDITWHIPLRLSSVVYKRLFNIIPLLFNLIVSLCKIFFILIIHRPHKVVCTGGFVSIPIVICARILAIPVELYELNVEPGKATRFLASWSIQLFICFNETQKFFPSKKCHKTAYPIRFFDDTKQISQKEALRELNFNQQRKTICILGGSQGSLEINKLMRDFITHNSHLYDHIQIIHQVGRKDGFNWHNFYQEHRIPALVYSFTQDIALYYSAADLIICRSGAGILFEVLFFSKPCITIPLETPQNNHQVANAHAMQHAYDELFTVIRQEQIKHTQEIFYKKIEQILNLYPPKATCSIQQPEL